MLLLPISDRIYSWNSLNSFCDRSISWLNYLNISIIYAILDILASNIPTELGNHKIYRIPTNEGLLSNLLQIKNLCKSYSLASKLSDKTKFEAENTTFLISPFSSKHYPDILNMNLCDYFSNFTCLTSEKDYQIFRIHCVKKLPLTILDDHQNCYAWNFAMTKGSVLREESLWGDIGTKLLSSKGLIDHNYIEQIKDANRLISTSPSTCLLGSIYWGGSDQNAIFWFKIHKKYSMIVNMFLKSANLTTNSKFGVVHLRRGDQLTSRCQLNHIDREKVFDFSVNCESVNEFIKVMRTIQSSYPHPVFIATNEKVKETIDAIQKSGLKIIHTELNKMTSLQLTSADLFMVELSMMYRSDRLWGSGQSTMHDFLGDMRREVWKEGWLSIPGINNRITNNTDVATEIVFNMFEDIKVEGLPIINPSNKIDTIGIAFKSSDILNGKLKLLINRVVNISISYHIEYKTKLKLFLIPTVSLSIHDVKDISTYFTDEMKKYIFIDNIRTEEVHESTNKMFFEVMSYLSSHPLDVNTVLLMDPSVTFTQINWFDRLYKLNSQQSYWIIGSYYCRNNNNINNNGRLNSIAMFRLGDPVFVDFIKALKSYSLLYRKIPFHRLLISFKQSWMAWAKNSEGTKYKIKMIERMILNTSIIINPLQTLELQ